MLNGGRVAPVTTATTSASPSLRKGSPTSSDRNQSPNLDDVADASAASVGDGHVLENGPAAPQGVATGAGNPTEEWLSAAHVSPESYMGWGDVSLPRPLEMWAEHGLAGSQVPRSTDSNIGMRRRSTVTEPPRPLKYPVLQPLMPFLEGYLSRRLAFDLLELYFTSAFSIHVHPVCHHIHCYILRKSSFLSREAPRQSSPALLASMLWVAALDHRAFALSISPHQRKRICQFLCSLTIRLLRPLVHVSMAGEGLSAGRNDSADAGHGQSPAAIFPLEATGDDRGLVGPAGSLDDVITYIHVASITSASEQKAASMRWWHAAFTLARELRLNQEIEGLPDVEIQTDASSPSYPYPLDNSTQERPVLNCVCDKSREMQHNVTEEYREERRRAWWLLYIMDRHLALCYNRPLALLDAESEDLLLPLDEGTWQAGDIHTNSPKPNGPQCLISGDKNKRRVFPDFLCHDHSIFGFFLPLMAITGELIDLNQARNHPLLGSRLQASEALNIHINEAMRQLEIYKASLLAFAAKVPNTEAPLPNNHQPEPTQQVSSAAQAVNPEHISPIKPHPPQAYFWHTQTVIAYASYLVHVLHILLMGKWDPVTLIEDKDFWTSSPAFASTISHALEAADSVEQILRFDPDLSFMPYFFGIQLLQGSFLLLLIVERLQKEAGEGILNACEVMIRATESCVVTLSTEYQRNFRQVMWSAVAQARGRPVNHSEIRHRRRAILALYRWTRNGTGLAL